MKLYIAVLDEVPDYIVPTLVAHSMLGAHLEFSRAYIATEDDEAEKHAPYRQYLHWLEQSFKKCVVKVNKREFDKIAFLTGTYLGHENKTLGGIKTCAIPLPVAAGDLPNVLKFAKLWAPSNYREGCTECHIKEESAKSDAEWKADIKKGREIIANQLGYLI